MTLEPITEREAELKGDEATIALRIVEWLNLLAKLREAAGAGVDPQSLVDQIKRIDPAMLDGAQTWLQVFLWQRFEAEFKHLNIRKKASEAAASKGCPYTAAEYDRAAAIAGTKQELLAFELSVDRKTLRKWGRPDV
jgi:hypothetical protein